MGPFTVFCAIGGEQVSGKDLSRRKTDASTGNPFVAFGMQPKNHGDTCEPGTDGGRVIETLWILGMVLKMVSESTIIQAMMTIMCGSMEAVSDGKVIVRLPQSMMGFMGSASTIGVLDIKSLMDL